MGWPAILSKDSTKYCSTASEMLFSEGTNERSRHLTLLMASAKCCTSMSERNDVST